MFLSLEVNCWPLIGRNFVTLKSSNSSGDPYSSAQWKEPLCLVLGLGNICARGNTLEARNRQAESNNQKIAWVFG